MMDKKTLDKFKKLLEKEKVSLEKELKTIAKPSTKGPKGDYKTKMPNIGDDFDENATEIAMYENALPLEHDFELRLRKINKALEKIEKGTYGICAKCKAKIAERRLKIYPEAKSCMKCHQH